MHPDIAKLNPYPFERLAQMYASITPNPDIAPLSMTIGGPKMQPPQAILNLLTSSSNAYNQYPPINGTTELREAISGWLEQRFSAAVDPDTQILALSGTREGLFSAVHALVDSSQPQPTVVLPNPFYKIYEGAALLAGAQLYPLDTTADNDFQPNLDTVPDEVWERCQVLFLCTPNNPTGSVLSLEQLKQALELAQKHNFYVLSDECYSELYPPGKPPLGLLQACIAAGHDDYSRALVFHSLSKRSSLAGLRSGFVAGDADVIKALSLYRSYHGVGMSLPLQVASTAAWSDESHVETNRQAYDARYAAALEHLEMPRPDGGFYLWIKVPGDECDFAKTLYEQENLQVLPGSFLAIQSGAGNPGHGYLRISLVDEPEHCAEGARRIARLLHQWNNR